MGDDRQMVSITFTRKELDVVLGAVERRIEDIDQEGTPADWAEGAELVHQRGLLAYILRHFDERARIREENQNG